MKKVILSLVLLCGIAFTAQAQEVGSKWVSGSVGVWSSKTGDAKRTTDFNFVPEFGYVIGENMGVGVKLGYARSNMELFGTPVKADSYGVAPFVRYTFCKGNIGGLFVDGGIGYEHTKYKATSGGSALKEDSFELGFRPGVSVNVCDRVALLGTFGFLGYQHSKIGDTKSNEFGLDLDLSQVMLGVSFIF